MSSLVVKEPKIKYSIKNDIQHVLDCSDVYIGDTASNIRKEYVYSDEHEKIIYQNINSPEALIRIFVEVLTNAVDNAERSKYLPHLCCKTIKINLDLETGLTSVWNDGRVIPIIQNKKQLNNNDLTKEEFDMLSDDDKKTFKKLNDLYIHSLIFGHFRSSSNYNTDDMREVSGKNGVGVKCTNIFSSYFCVIGVDPERHLKLTQEWTNNMTKTTDPIVKTCSESRGYTKVQYIPDFKRFNLNSYPKEIYSIFKKLAVDISSLLPEINIYFNDYKIPVKNLTMYSKLYYNDEEIMNTLAIKYEGSNVVIVGSETSRQPISFVNGQITKDGGQHVQSWTKTVFSSLLDVLNKSTSRKDKTDKKEVKLTKGDIAPYFQFFIHSRVSRPKFDGQNKNILKSPKVQSHLEKLQLNKLLKWSVITIIKDKVLKSKEFLVLKKIECIPSKRKTIVKVDGYDPANKLGTESILIVCEGLSAKSYAVSGIQTGIFGKKGRNYFGILPLKGKFLNVKNVSLSKIGANKVVSDLIKVFNLKFNIDYSLPQNYKTLNYGTLLILTDADKDGIHIKGLILNFLHELFPTLFKKEGFVISMETPIVKVFRKKSDGDLLFYDENTFETYRRKYPCIKNFKYYKGLGTINPLDVSLFFGKKMVKYNYDNKGEVSINKVFKDENANERKLWLNSFNPRISRYCLDTLPESDEKRYNITTKLINVKVSDFMEHEMIKFSYEDCKRSLASCIDGLKESQRKVIYAIRKKFKSKQTDFIKVAQLSGYVAEQTDYKHGEQNLCETIIKFAQDFVGTNNISLLESDGQFGTRLEGGKDSAASRYIYTKPHKILKYIFREEDDSVLEYTIEGEPVSFVPVIPLILINGSVGIGTGWSCFIPQFNPMELINHIYKKLSNTDYVESLDIDPYYKNFKGKIKSTDDKFKYTTYGKMKRIDEHTIQVTELPIGMWTDKFKDQCYSLIEKGLLSQLINESTTNDVNFILKDLQDISAVKLTSTLHTTNMVLFNRDSIITKYNTIDEILNEYFETRLHFYKLRKNHMLTKLQDNINLNENKLKFILKIVDNENFLKQDETMLVDILEKEKFLKLDNTYNYLLNISIRSCTLNSVMVLKKTIENLKQELVELKKLTINQMWLKELDEVKKHLN
jgi:DNA topoisomerase-2